MGTIKKAYFYAVFRYWDWLYMRTRDETLAKGHNAMALAYKQKYRLIKYRPKGVRK
jgi:hypothetical protein